MVWGELTLDKRKKIAYRYHTGEHVDNIAKDYQLKPQSLARRIRELKYSNKYDEYVKDGSIYFIQHDQIATHTTTGTITVSGNINDPVIVIPAATTLYGTTSAPTIAKSYGNTFLDAMCKMEKTGANCITSSDIRYEDADDINERKVLLNSKKQWSILYFTDLHCPLQDNDAVKALMRVFDRVEHNLVINGGDNLDLYGLSSFSKEVNQLFRNNFAKEVSEHDKIMQMIAERSDKPKISLYGNHMIRYDKWLSNTPFMSMSSKSFSSLQLDALLSMEYYGWYPFVGNILVSENKDASYPKPTLIFTHGEKAKRGGGESALSQFRDWGAVSYIMGHTHRMAVVYKRTLHGQHVVAEGGTLRNLNPDYVKYPDWQNGLLHITADGDKIVVTPIMILGGNAYIGNAKL